MSLRRNRGAIRKFGGGFSSSRSLAVVHLLIAFLSLLFTSMMLIINGAQIATWLAFFVMIGFFLFRGKRITCSVALICLKLFVQVERQSAIINCEV